MKQILLSTLFTIGSASCLMAQDVIYTANGNRLENAQLTSVTEDKVSFVVQKPDKVSTFSFQRKNVLVAFNRMGNFLVISELGDDLPQAQQRLQSYLTAPPRPKDVDFLIKAVPLSVIPVSISYESDVVVNYKTHDGQSASIPKAELVGILYRNGKHVLFRDPSEVAPLLTEVRNMINTERATSTQSPKVIPVPPQVAHKDSTLQGTKTQPLQVSKIDTSLVIDSNKVTSNTESNKLSETDYQSYRKKPCKRWMSSFRI